MAIVREREFSREIHQHFFLDISNVAAFRAELGIPPETDLGALELGLEQWAAMDRRLTGYRAVLLLSEAPDLGDATPWPTFRREDTPGSPTCRLWLWRVRYGEAMAYGEFRWTAGQGALRQVVAPGWAPSVGHEDVLRAWQGLDLLLGRVPWGRPRGSGFEHMDSPDKCQASVFTAMRVLRTRGLRVTQTRTADQLFVSANTLKNYLKRYGFRWMDLTHAPLGYPE